MEAVAKAGDEIRVDTQESTKFLNIFCVIFLFVGILYRVISSLLIFISFNEIKYAYSKIKSTIQGVFTNV